jgi:hypothetical protein
MRTAFFIFLTLTSLATAQSVYLRVDTLASGNKTTARSTSGYGSYEESQASGINIKVTLRNMYPQPYTYTLEWRFFAKDLQTRKNRVHDSGTNSVPLKVGETKTFELESAPLSSSVSGYSSWYYSSRYASGEKQAGYLVLVKDGNRILAVDSDDAGLKRSYMDAVNAARLQPKPVAQPPKPR